MNRPGYYPDDYRGPVSGHGSTSHMKAHSLKPWPRVEADAVRTRIADIEAMLKKPLEHGKRKELVREYLDLTNPDLNEVDL